MGTSGYFVGVEITQDRYAMVEVTRVLQHNSIFFFITDAKIGDKHYNRMTSVLKGIVKRLEESDLTHVIVNRTVIGERIAAESLKLGLEAKDLHLVRITSAEHEDTESETWRVPILDLQGVIQVLLQTGRLLIQEEYWHSDINPKGLIEALRNYHVNLKEMANDAPKIWGEGDYGDLIIATGLACWTATHSKLHPTE
jgi:hypothetical protein